MTALDLNAVRERLMALQAEYEQRIDQINQRLSHPPEDMANDWSDRAKLHQNDDATYSLRQEAVDQLAEVNAALQRLEAGSYGRCEVCGEDIETGRLSAMPEAVRCVQHAQ